MSTADDDDVETSHPASEKLFHVKHPLFTYTHTGKYVVENIFNIDSPRYPRQCASGQA